MHPTVEYIKVQASALESFLNKIFSTYPFNPEVKRSVVNHLLAANLYGIDSHGLQQVTGYKKSLESGRINPAPVISVLQESDSMMLYDGGGGPGQYVAEFVMQQTIKRAQTHGMSVAGIVNSNHFGVAGIFTRMAANADMIGFASSDTNVVDLAPFGGSVPKLGNNPLSWAIPTNLDFPLVLDMACAAVSGGKLRHNAYEGKEISLGLGLDASGSHTNNPAEIAFNLPGSFKAYGLAMIMDVICGPLLGTAASLFKKKSQLDAANGTGHFLMVINPATWGGIDHFKAEVTRLIRDIQQSPGLDSVEEILVPGELEYRHYLERSSKGIPLPESLIEDLRQIYGSDLLSILLAPAV